MLHVEKITDAQGLARLQGEWAVLMEAAKDATIFQTHEWVSAWWESFGVGHDLFILMVREENRTLGVVPLMIEPSFRKGIRIRTLKAIGEPWLDLFDFVIADRREEVIAAVVGYLAESSSEWDVASLREIPEGSDTLPILLDRLTEQGFACELSECSRAIRVDLLGGWQACEARLLRDPTLRRVIRSKMGRLAALGKLSLKPVGDEVLEEHLRGLFEMHARRWRRNGRESPLAATTTRGFFRDVARRLQARGFLNLIALTLDERPIAYHLGYEYRDVLYQHVPTFDVAFEKYSPGLILHYELLRDAAARGFSAFDFLRGEERYKLPWGEESRRNYAVEVYHEPRLSKSFFIHQWRKVGRLVAARRVWQAAGVIALGRARSLRGQLFRQEKAILLEWDGRLAENQPALPIKIRCAERRDATRLPYFMDLVEFLARLRKGDLCYVAECDGRIVSTAWVGFRENFVSEVEYLHRFANDTVYVYNTHTDQDFRGRGIYVALIGHILSEFGRRGIRVQILTVTGNTRALEIHRRLFGKEIMEIRLVKCLGFRTHRIKRLEDWRSGKIQTMAGT